jgi:hypothetical protein
VSTKRKKSTRALGSSYDQQHPCEKECQQLNLSERVQNGKKRDSTICEEEFHQPKPSVRVKKNKLRDSTIHEESHKNLYEKYTQKLSEVED